MRGAELWLHILLLTVFADEAIISAFQHIPTKIIFRHSPTNKCTPIRRGTAAGRNLLLPSSSSGNDHEGEESGCETEAAKGRLLGSRENRVDEGPRRTRVKLDRRSLVLLAAGLVGGTMLENQEALALSESKYGRRREFFFQVQKDIDPETISQGRVLSQLQAEEQCSYSWSPNWRKTGKGNTCLMPDGCLWRKIDVAVKYPGGVEGFMNAENHFSMSFIAYLSRFLLNFDPRWSSWWLIRQSAIPAGASEEEEDRRLREDFSSFMSSVEYGLADYRGREGVELLAEELEAAYGSLSAPALRQLGVLFALQDGGRTFYQPSRQIERFLGWSPVVIGPGEGAADELAQWQQAMNDLRDKKFSRFEMPPLLPTTFPLFKAPDERFSLPGKMEPEDFGVRAYTPVKRERRITSAVYLAFALSGLVGCAGTHVAVVPLDVVKTREQTSPGRYGSLANGIATIWREEGIKGMFTGLVPTTAGYAWYGMTVYPGYEVFKRFFVQSVGEQFDAQYHVGVVLLAGACSTAIACIGVCPAEATRIRQVAMPGYAPSAWGVAQKIVREEGFFPGLYEGFSFLLARQISFGMMKFLVFDYFSNFIFDTFPMMDDNEALQLSVSLLSGAVAGVVSSIVSQPADTVLTKMKESKAEHAGTVINRISKQYGLKGFFLGLGSRCVWAGSIIAGQFVVYDLCKNLLQVTSEDLTLFLDVLGSIKLAAPDL